MPLVKLVKVNHLQYNANRDPQVYRVIPNQEFVIQAYLAGSGQADCQFTVENLHFQNTVERQEGIFECRFSFATPGIRLGRLTVRAGNEEFIKDIRLDVLDHAWIG